MQYQQRNPANTTFATGYRSNRKTEHCARTSSDSRINKSFLNFGIAGLSAKFVAAFLHGLKTSQ